MSDLYNPDGEPIRVRCYDNGGESADRYTVVFTGKYRHKTDGEFWYVGMSDNPYHPQGVGMHGSSPTRIDGYGVSTGHLGKRLQFNQLPKPCQDLVISTYADLWDAPAPNREAA